MKPVVAARMIGAVVAAALTLTACAGEGGEPEQETATTAASSDGGSPEESAGSDEPSPSSSEEEETADDAPESAEESGPDEDAGADEEAEATASAGEAGSGGDGDSEDASDDADASVGAAGSDMRSRLEELAPLVPLAEDMPGTALVGEDRRAAANAAFEMNLSVTGVETPGECGRLIREIDEFVRPGSAAGFSQYEVDQTSAEVIGQAEAFSSVVITPEEEDIMGLFGDLPQTCGDLSQGAVTARFEPVEGVEDAARLVMEAQDERIDVVMGGASDGDEHVYAGFVNIEPDLADEMMRAQVEAFEDRDG